MTHEPIRYHGVMISSTFTDLEEHRQALIKALNNHGLMHVAMENSPALADREVIESSYNMVRNASAYILVIGHKYGQTPSSTKHNLESKSITELEFNEAQKLGRPTLLFIVGENHFMRKGDIELDAVKRGKLEAFRERAKKWNEEPSVQRVYSTFESLEEFKDKVGPSIAGLKQLLIHAENNQLQAPSSTASEVVLDGPKLPQPPQLYAHPPYLASHQFVGREDYLLTLDDWAQQSDTHPVCLFEAIGGSGKSILTWNWLINRSDKIRTDWAGRFWYSFYERGAETRDFLVHALSYMTGRPRRQLQKKDIGELFELLLQQLRAEPWLFVLDGIERLLVSYHRFDAAHVDDDLAGTEDLIGRRDPLAMIYDEDSDLFQSFLTAVPSKLLITTRLTPRCLVNSAHQPLPELLHHRLPGLRPEDAEILFRDCDVHGNSDAIQSYLKENCDCHPLVIGFLAGLINRYLPARSNFDAWVNSSTGGLALNLADLDLVQRRNHILKAAIEVLPNNSRELLSTIAMVSSGFDYRVLIALSPTSEQEKFDLSEQPSENSQKDLDDVPKTEQHRSQFDLHEAITDLEKRGLLLFDKIEGLYDLHPVVRGVIVGGLAHLELERLGGKVVDYFSATATMPLKKAQTLDDVQTALQVVHTYLAMGKLEEAWNSFDPELFLALRLNLEEYDKCIAILRPFFSDDWSILSKGAPPQYVSRIFNSAGVILDHIGLYKESMCSHISSLLIDLETKDWFEVLTSMLNIASVAKSMGKLAVTSEILDTCIAFSEVICNGESIFLTHLDSMGFANSIGDQHRADDHWRKLDPLGRGWSFRLYRPGEAEFERLRYQLQYDCLL